MDVQAAQAPHNECRGKPAARLRGDDTGVGVEVLGCRLRRESADEKRGTRRKSREQPAHDAILPGHEQHRYPERMRHADAARAGGQHGAKQRNQQEKTDRPWNEPVPVGDRHHLGQ
jgi:hypothetical protein